MKTGRKGVDLVKSFESLQTRAYRCPAGVLTIGYGHTAGVRDGDTCTALEAEQMLEQDLQVAESAVNALNVPLSQNQFDALVSFCFNIGTSAFARSTLRRKVVSDASDLSIRAEFLKWKFVKGNVVRGLLRRRQAESDLYFRK